MNFFVAIHIVLSKIGIKVQKTLKCITKVEFIFYIVRHAMNTTVKNQKSKCNATFSCVLFYRIMYKIASQPFFFNQNSSIDPPRSQVIYTKKIPCFKCVVDTCHKVKGS